MTQPAKPAVHIAPIDELLDAYARLLVAERNLSPYTLRNYRTDLADFVRFMNGTEKADPLTVNRQSFRRYLAELRDRNVATTSVSRKVSTIKGFFRFLQREGKLPANPLALVSPPKRARLLPTILRKDHLVALIEAADETTPGGLRNRAILELMYAAGVRLSEVVGLDLESLDLSEHTVRVRGKGNKERIVLIGQPAAQALARYLRDGRARLVGDPCSALFLNRDGTRLSGRSMQKIVRQHALRAGLEERVHPHLRSPPTERGTQLWTARKRKRLVFFLAVAFVPPLVLAAILGFPAVVLVVAALGLIPNVWLVRWLVNRRLRSEPPTARRE